MECTLRIAMVNKYQHVIGLLRIGTLEWLEDGTPCVQREPGEFED